MRSIDSTLHLLIGCDSQAQLESTIGLFRQAGHTTRAHRISSLNDLGDMLRDQHWDLLIADDNHPEVQPSDALKRLQQLKSDTPCLVRAGAPDAARDIEWLRQGAREVLAEAENERLLMAALREISAVREHRELGELRLKYAEIAERAELLLAASQEAIAYVVDGMHVHTNDVYAEMFGYSDAEAMASIPLVDLIAADNQQDFKAALRRYRNHPDEQTTIEFTAVCADGTQFPGTLVLSSASFEGELCMQVQVRARSASAPGPGTAAPESRGMAALEAVLGQSRSGHLLLIGVDGYAQHCRNLGLANALRLIDALGLQLPQAGGWSQSPLRVGDQLFALVVPATDPQSVLEEARRCVEQVAARIHDIGKRSLSCNICIAVCPLPNDGGSIEAFMDQSFDTLARTAERAERLRGADPARVELLRSATESVGPQNGGPVALEQAIQAGELRLLFQPIVSLRGDRSEYYEVHVQHVPSEQKLAAWLESEQLGDPSTDLDHWTVTEACRRLATHRGRHPQTSLIISLGSGSIMDPDFVTWLGETLRAAELSPESVVIQISHTDASSHLREAKQLTEKLHALGCQVSVSHVHSANNPIADLAHLKPQFARIAEDLSQALNDGDSTNTLLKPLIEALHQEQMASIMTNVESASVLAVLWQLGVNFIQGDYLQSPSPDMTYEFADLA